MYFWVVVAVAVAVVALMTLGQGGVPSYLPSMDYDKSSPTPSASPKVSPGKPSGAKATPATSSASVKTYNELIKEYDVGGRRVQFDQRCQMSPSAVTYKNGTKIMLDNRSAEAKKITIGGSSYSLGAYGYQLVTLSSTKMPQEFIINCGSAVNVGKILLQALISQ